MPQLEVGGKRKVSEVKITLVYLGYPNRRYQEVPPIKPSNLKKILSFFTEGVQRVLDMPTNFDWSSQNSVQNENHFGQHRLSKWEVPGGTP